ncbi:hypothetical protein [Rosistilla oblonga]|uniref:hypothetical protein n=1 Tax=Rosistilla oblonga TaxID=2527990 RepID=UPI003A97C743
MTNSRLFTCLLVVACTSIASAQNDAASPFGGSDSSIAQQWVQVDSAGTLHGRVDVPVAGGLRRADLVRIALLPLGGGEAATTVYGKTTLEGSFTIPQVSKGTYAMLVHSTDVLACYTVHVLPANGSETPDHLHVLAARTNSDFVMQRIRSYIPMQPSLPYAIKQFDTDPVSDRKPSSEGQVFADSTGAINGRLSLPAGSDGKSPAIRNMNVIVVQGDKSVAMAAVDGDGNFSVPKLTPGSYGLIAAGESGFAAVGFELTAPTTTSHSPRTTRFVSFNAAAAGETELNVEVVPGFAVESIQKELQPSENGDQEVIGEGVALDEFGWPVDPNAVPRGPTASSMGSAQAGSSGGGGGGSGGGGGLGGLGAIGLAAAALAAQDNNSVASPANP